MRALFLLLSITSSFYGMDPVDIDKVVIPSNTKMAISFLTTRKLDLFDHDMICSLAINKEWEKILLHTAAMRRGRLAEMLVYFSENSDIIWHKYGTACGKKVITKKIFPKDEYEYECKLASTYWDYGYYRHYGKPWDCTQEMLTDIIPLRFNAKGNLCCYSRGKKSDIMLWHKCEHVIEYCLKRHDDIRSCLEENRCGLNLKLEDYPHDHYALSHFIYFPVLLRAFLCSKRDNEKIPLYNLESAIIPDNYKACVLSRKYKLFEDLPEILREAINKRYNECNFSRR